MSVIYAWAPSRLRFRPERCNWPASPTSTVATDKQSRATVEAFLMEMADIGSLLNVSFNCSTTEHLSILRPPPIIGKTLLQLRGGNENVVSSDLRSLTVIILPPMYASRMNDQSFRPRKATHPKIGPRSRSTLLSFICAQQVLSYQRRMAGH